MPGNMTFERKKVGDHFGYVIEDPASGFTKELTRPEAAVLMAEIAKWISVYHVCEEENFKQEWMQRQDG